MSDPAETQSETQSEVQTRIIRWIGEPARYKTRHLRGGQTEQVLDWEFERGREAPTPNASVRALKPSAIPELSREYHWGPKKPFISEMTDTDADVLLASSVGYKFIDVTEDPIVEKNEDAIRRLGDPLWAPKVKALRPSNGTK